MEGMVQTRASVLGMEERRNGREEDGYSLLCCRLIIVGSWLEPTVIEHNHCRSWLKPAVMSACQNTAGSSHKPAVMWSFPTGFSLVPIIFFIFKLITYSEGTSQPVLTNPIVMCKSGVVLVCCCSG